MTRRSVLLTLALAALAGTASPARADVLVAGYVESSVRRYAEDGTPLPPLVPPGGMSGVVGPAGLAFGPAGFLYVSNQLSVFVPGAPDSIVKVHPTTGVVMPFIVLPTGYVPAGLRFGPDGDLYVCRNGGQAAGAGTGAVDRYDGVTGEFLGAVVKKLTQPTGLVFDADGNLYISNFGEGTIVKARRRSSLAGSTFTLVPAGGGGLVSPAGLQVGPDGLLYVTDLLVGAVRVYNTKSGAHVGDFVPPGGALNNEFPSDLIFDRRGQVLVANLGASFTEPLGNVKAFNADTGQYIRDFATGIVGASQVILTPTRYRR